MKYADYRLSLDLFKTVSQATLPVKHGDTAYRICITITANGSPYIITEGCYALFTAKKPDGNFINNKCTIENNTIYYCLTPQTTAALGIVECEIVLYDANDEQLATPHFNILVDKKAYNGEKIVSSSEVNMLEDLIEESKAQIADVEKRLANGEFVGEKGEAGTLEMIPVNELPTENIKDGCVYAIPAENPTEDNECDEYYYENGKWERWGGASIGVDLSNYVKNTDYATQGKGGIVKVFPSSHGLSMANGEILCISKASESTIDKRTADGNNQYRALTVNILDYAVKKALADCKLTTWEDDEKAAARTLLGAIGGTDYADYDNYGVVRIASTVYGLELSGDKKLKILKATNTNIDERSSIRPIVPENLDYAIKSGLTKNTLTLTAEERAKAQAWLGIGGSGASTKQTVTLTSIEEKENQNVNFPVKLNPNKTYNAMLQFTVIDSGGESSTNTAYFENVSATDGLLSGVYNLNLAIYDDGDVYHGIRIFFDMFYDSVTNGTETKDGWVWVQTEYPSVDYKHKFTLTLTEA